MTDMVFSISALVIPSGFLAPDQLISCCPILCHFHLEYLNLLELCSLRNNLHLQLCFFPSTSYFSEVQFQLA